MAFCALSDSFKRFFDGSSIPLRKKTVYQSVTQSLSETFTLHRGNAPVKLSKASIRVANCTCAFLPYCLLRLFLLLSCQFLVIRQKQLKPLTLTRCLYYIQFKKERSFKNYVHHGTTVTKNYYLLNYQQRLL